MNRNQKAKSRSGLWIYIIRKQNSDLAKIGFSSDPKRRLKELQKESSLPLKISSTFRTPNSLADAKGLEKYLHKQNRIKRIEGEWFENISDSEIKELCLKYHQKRMFRVQKKAARSLAATRLSETLSKIIEEIENSK